MNYDYNNFSDNIRIIKKETKTTVLICISMVLTVFIYAFIAYYLSDIKKTALVTIPADTLQNLLNTFNIAAILMVVIVLAVRKTIYYSPRTIKDDFSLTQVLAKWRVIDIILAAVAESISLLGLAISLLGMPFGRTFHFFITSVLVILIVMPVNWKVRDKLRILKEQRDMNVGF